MTTIDQAARISELAARAAAAHDELRAAVVEAAATMTEVDLARLSGVSRPTIRKWKAGADTAPYPGSAPRRPA